MTTYIYETIPSKPGIEPTRFEIRQSMSEAPLTRHPETGEPVRRIISGGFGFVAQKASLPSQPCGTQCGCHGLN